MSDTPKIHSTMNDLDSASQAGPFRQSLKGGKIIAFPDPGVMDWLEAEEFLQDIQGAASTKVMVERWLSEADFKKLVDSKLNLYQMQELGKRVGEHYKALFGDQGNGIASSES